MAMTSTRNGTAVMTSTVRMITASIHPPRYPAAAPSSDPARNGNTTASTPIRRSMAAPCTTRVRTSRPKLSVPNGC